jgi:outer membrane immunogenic protein
MRCKSYLLATVSALAIVGVVSIASPVTAADLPARAPVMPVKAPIVAPAEFNWTGGYVGIHGGAAWLKHRQTTLDPNFACGTGSFGPLAPSDCTLEDTGAMFGGFAGYNFQSGRVVYGVEVDGSWLGVKRSESYGSTPLVDPLTLHTKVSWLATARGRLGIAMSPTLIYVTGGAAFAGVKSGWHDSDTPPTGLSVDKTKVGWVAGGGVEHAFARNWSLRVEALYHDLGKVSAGPVTEAGVTYNTTFRHKIVTARAGLALRW